MPHVERGEVVEGMWHERVAMDYQRRLAAGLSQDDMIAELHQQGFSLVDSVKIVKQACAASLFDAHHVVRDHPVWRASRVDLPWFTIGVQTKAPLAQVAATVGLALRVAFQERDSLYYGGQYFLAKLPPEEIRIYRNADPHEHAPVYEDARDCPVLIEFRVSQRRREDVLQNLSGVLMAECRIVRPTG